MIVPQTEAKPSKESTLAESKRPVPPEPKKRTRKASTSSLEKDVILTFDKHQSVEKEAGEDLKGTLPKRSVEKDLVVVKTGAQLDSRGESKGEASRNFDNLTKLTDINKERMDEPLRKRENDVSMEAEQPANQLKKLVQDDQPQTVSEQKRRSLVCLQDEGEGEVVPKQPAEPSEKESKVDTKILAFQRETHGKEPEMIVGKILTQPDETSAAQDGGGERAEPFKPPVRSRGRLALEDQPNSVLKETKESEKPTVKVSKEQFDQRGQVILDLSTTDTPKEKTGEKSEGKLDTTLANEVEQALPKPPARVKSKAKSWVEKQYSRDTETDQDDQQVAGVMMKTNNHIANHSAEDVKEDPTVQNQQSVTEQFKQPAKVPDDYANAKQSLKQLVKPIIKDPEPETKMAVGPMRREEEQHVRNQAEGIPPLYISEDEAFMEALSELPVDSQPPDQPPTTKTPQDATLDTPAEPGGAGVNVQPAFKSYRTSRDMKPVFSEVFKNQTAELHSTLTLVCVVEGQPSTVRWLRNAQDITNDQRRCSQTTEAGVCSLVIRNLSSADGGVYTCEAANKFGTSSYNGNVTVVLPQPDDTRAASPPQNRLPAQAEGPAGAVSYVESVNVSLWEAYKLTEQLDSSARLQERRSSLLGASSSE